MNPTTNTIQAYFLIDRSEKVPEQFANTIKYILDNLVTRLQRDPQVKSYIQFNLVNMGQATCQLITPYEPQRNVVNGACDLGEGLRLVEQHLKATKPTRSDISVWLYREPSGNWQQQIASLKTYDGVRVTVLATREVQHETIQLVKTERADHKYITALGKSNVQHLCDDIYKRLRESVIAQTRLQMPPHQHPLPSDTSRASIPVLTPDNMLSSETPPPGLHISIPNNDSQDEPDPSETPHPPSAVERKPPPVDESGRASIWKEIEPPEDPDWVDHTDVKRLTTLDRGWHIVGASRRGKMHAHKGIFREDAFQVDEVDGWQLMVVADGCGSCPLSRVGSQLAADTAVAAMKKVIESRGSSLPEDVGKRALREALEQAWQALEKESLKRNVPLGHLGTTFLAVIHYTYNAKSLVGVLQVGDGLLAARHNNGTLEVLAEPDAGETAGTTYFLTSKEWTAWIERAKVYLLADQPQMLAAMCDGVADDFIPFDEHLPDLFSYLDQCVNHPQPEMALLEWLNYPKRGSFDDRTVTLIYRADKGKPTTMDQTEQETLLSEPDEGTITSASLLQEANLIQVEPPDKEHPEASDPLSQTENVKTVAYSDGHIAIPGVVPPPYVNTTSYHRIKDPNEDDTGA